MYQFFPFYMKLFKFQILQVAHLRIICFVLGLLSQLSGLGP